MQKPDRGQSESLFRTQFEKAFEKDNLLTLRNCEHFSVGLSGAGASFTRARDSAKTLQVHSYYSGYVFKADIRDPYKVFREGFEPLQMQMVKVAGSSRNRLKGGVLANLSAIATGYFMVLDFSAHIFVYLIDATPYSGIMEHEPNMTAAYRNLQPGQAQSCNVLYTHPILSTDIIGCVWSSQFPNPHQAKQYWPPHIALGPGTLSLAVNPEYDKGMKGAEEAAWLFSIG